MCNTGVVIYRMVRRHVFFVVIGFVPFVHTCKGGGGGGGDEKFRNL